MNLQLSDHEARVISAMQHRAGTPVSEIARLCGLREHQVRYVMQRLSDRGILLGRSLLVDVYRLGFTYFTVSFSFHSERQTNADEVIKAFGRSPNVAFVGLVGGEFQYVSTICARSVDEVKSLLEGLSRTFGNFILDKSFGAHITFSAYGRRCLTTRKMPYPVLSYGKRGVEPYRLSPAEHQVLGILAHDSSLSVRDVSRKIGIPASTVHRHVQNLEKQGVINGELYTIRLQDVGALQFKVLVYARGINPGVTTQLQKFCAGEKIVLRLIDCLGNWDYEIDIEVSDAEEVHHFTTRLFMACGNDLNTVKILQILRHLKFTSYPFAP